MTLWTREALAAHSKSSRKIVSRDGNNGPTEMRRDKRRLAIHEAGHAIAAHLLGERINYITILADTGASKAGNFAYGKVSCLPSVGQEQSSTYLKNQIVFCLASRAAEELFVGDVYVGVHGDMASAHSAAKKLGETLDSQGLTSHLTRFYKIS